MTNFLTIRRLTDFILQTHHSTYPIDCKGAVYRRVESKQEYFIYLVALDRQHNSYVVNSKLIQRALKFVEFDHDEFLFSSVRNCKFIKETAMVFHIEPKPSGHQAANAYKQLLSWVEHHEFESARLNREPD